MFVEIKVFVFDTMYDGKVGESKVIINTDNIVAISVDEVDEGVIEYNVTMTEALYEVSEDTFFALRKLIKDKFGITRL